MITEKDRQKLDLAMYHLGVETADLRNSVADWLIKEYGDTENGLTVKEAKKLLREQWDEGTICPCCNQTVKLYRRTITSSMAWALILLYREYRDQMHPFNEWIHIEDFLKGKAVPSSVRGDVSKLRFWDLIEKKIDEREDGSNRVGYYKITEQGKLFVENRITVPKIIKLYNNTFYGFDGEEINIRDALDNRFNYSTLMGNYADKPIGNSERSLFS